MQRAFMWPAGLQPCVRYQSLPLKNTPDKSGARAPSKRPFLRLDLLGSVDFKNRNVGFGDGC
jgi:hypothetical protein